MPSSVLNTNLMEESLINFPRKLNSDGSLGWESAILPFDYTYNMLKPHNCINATTGLGVTLEPLGNSRKNRNRGDGGGGRGHGISRGIEERSFRKSWGQVVKRGISRGDQGKFVSNFHGSWFHNLKFPRGATQFCGISKREDLFFFRDFQWRSNKPKNPGGFFQKVIFSTTVFSGIAHFTSVKLY